MDPRVGSSGEMTPREDLSHSQAFSDLTTATSEHTEGKERKSKGSRCRRIRTDTLDGSYEMTKGVLGTGMSGEVKVAVHRETGEKVAVKTFTRKQLCRKGVVDMIRETKIHASFDHPNIVKVRDIFQSTEHAYLVIEHLDGGDALDHICQAGALSENKVRLAVKQVLQALAYMHELGFAHRDIKPENIMYHGADQDKVKLIDFGLCCEWREGQAPMSRCCGTDAYMAPEVVQGCYTSKADMWSLGATVHTMLTGEMMGRSRDWFPVMSKHFWKLSAEAQRFVEDLLTVDPAMRMSAAEALRHSWMENAFSDRITDGTLTESTTASSRRISALVTDQTDSDEELGVAFGCCGSLKSRSAAKAGRVSLVQSLWSNLLGAKAPRQDSPVKEGVWSPGQEARKPSLPSWLSRG
jgi:serine/threonine/tyrosine protein kinase RAD53